MTTQRSDVLDLIISGGTVVTASSQSVAAIGIRDGRVVHLGAELPAHHVIDAHGKFILPGGIDPHVHLSAGVMPDGELLHWADDYESGTKAAAAGGITTVGDMSYPRIGESLTTMVNRAVREASTQAVVDFMIHPIIVNPNADVRDELAPLAAAGHTSLKFFMIRDSFDPQSTEFTRLLRTAGEEGILSMVHCEDGCVCSHQINHLMETGRDGVEHYAVSRPEYAEEAAVVRAIALARAADAPLYVVHISTRAALDAIQRARIEGFEVYAETRPLYLYQDDSVYSETDGAKFVGRPPVRSSASSQAMMSGLIQGSIHTYSTDHAPWQLDEKLDPALNIGNQFRPGHADLDTLLPQLYSHAVRTGKMTLQRFVEITSTNAARLFGLFPQKGTIAIGSDADLVVWDPNLEWTIDSTQTHTRSDFSLYEGETIVGRPTMTLVRGTVVYDNGTITANPGHGGLVRRNRSGRL